MRAKARAKTRAKAKAKARDKARAKARKFVPTLRVTYKPFGTPKVSKQTHISLFPEAGSRETHCIIITFFVPEISKHNAKYVFIFYAVLFYLFALFYLL